MNITASVTESMSTGTLRRGFLGANDKDSLVGPKEYREHLTSKMNAMQEERDDMHKCLGLPNNKNFKHKFKGKEHLLGKNQYLAKRYFDIGDDIEVIKVKLSKLNKWIKSNTDFSGLSDFMILMGVLEKNLDKEKLEMITNEFKNASDSLSYNKEDWHLFLSEITG